MMNLQEVGCGGMDWIGLAQDRGSCWEFVTVLLNLQVPQNAGNFLTTLELVSFSKTLLQGVSDSTGPKYMYIFTSHVNIYV
jgi:hypothetical protein